MLEDVKNIANNQVSYGDTRIKSSDFASKPSFKGNPNAVDNTPSADTYQGQELPPEMSFGQKFMKYMVPTWLGLHFGTEAFNKANGGEYEKSLVGRLGKLGDRISGTRLVNNSFMDKLTSSGRTLKNNLKAFISRHPILNAMDKTPTAPECPLVTNFLETQAEADLKEGASKLKDYLDKNPKTLRGAGATDAEIDAFKTKYGTSMGRVKNQGKAVEEFLINKIGNDLGHTNMMTTVERREAAIAQQIERYKGMLSDPNLNPSAKDWVRTRLNSMYDLQSNYRANTLKRLKLQSMGVTEKLINESTKHPAGNGAKIEKALESAKNYSPKLAQFYNKVKSITAPTSKLGKFLPKAAKLAMRGLTFGGGLFNTLFVAFFMGDAVKNTIDAPKEQKASTFMTGLMEAMSWVIAMPLALKGMHAVNGIKNLGKSEAQVNTFKDALKEFNKHVKAGHYADKAVYDSKLAELLAKKNVGTAPKGFGKVLSKVAQFLSIGLEQISPYKASTEGLSTGAKISTKLGNLKRFLPNLGKNIIGYPLRFALYMFAFQPIVDKLFSAPLKAVFGEPFEPEKIREEQEKAKEQAEMEAMRKKLLYPGATFLPNPEAVKGLDSLDVNTLADDNLVKQELIKKGLAQPNGKTSTKNNGYTNSVNGVQIDIHQGNKPFMPPEYDQNGNRVNVTINNGQNEKDPNKSDYDTVPRSYVPQINYENPVAYSDPFTDPTYDRNYENMQKSSDTTEKFIAETEEMIRNKFRD